MIIALGCLIMGGLLTYWWTWDARAPFHDLRPAEVFDMTGKSTTALRLGQHFVVVRYGCFDRNDLIGRTYTVWEDGLVFTEPDVPIRKIDLGCRTRYYPTVVPSDLPTGRVFTRRTFVEPKFNWLMGVQRFELPAIKITVLP